jgi:hypothetical protein
MMGLPAVFMPIIEARATLFGLLVALTVRRLPAIDAHATTAAAPTGHRSLFSEREYHEVMYYHSIQGADRVQRCWVQQNNSQQCGIDG